VLVSGFIVQFYWDYQKFIKAYPGVVKIGEAPAMALPFCETINGKRLLFVLPI
jgi:hypothetical protein